MSGQVARQGLGRFVRAAILAVGLCAPAAGQQSAPAEAATGGQPAEPPASQPAGQAAPPAANKRRDLFHLDYLDGDVELESQYDWQRAKFPVNNPYSAPRKQNQTDRIWQMDETLGLRAAGDLVDPEWFTYNMALRLGTSQDIARETSPFDRLSYGHNGWLSEYNINLGIMPAKPVHFDVYTAREDGRLNRLFLPSLWHEAWRTGVTALLESDRFPMELTFEQTRDTYSGDIDSYDNEDVKDTILRYGGTARFTPSHQLRIDYQRDERHERYPGTATRFDTTQNALRLDDQLQFGPQQQHLWQNTLEYEEDTGDLPRNHIYLGSRVFLRHSKQLTTEYKYEYSRDSYGDTTLSTDRPNKSDAINFDTNRFDWIGTWLPRDWLTATSDVFAAHNRSDEGLRSDLVGGLFRVSGNRENRYGTFSGTIGYQYDYADTDFGGRTGTQIYETVTFRKTAPVFLTHSDVVAGSILVTDLRRTQVYLPGKDYLSFTSGRYTALIRQPFGRIAEGQPVRVYYRYRTISGGRFQNHQFDARVQEDFKSGWTPYYQVLLRRQSIDTTDTFFIEPNNVDQQRLGVTYHRKTWLVGGEAEFNDETVDPYDAIHFNGTWAVLERLCDRLDARSDVSQYWYRGHQHWKPTVFNFGMDYHRSLTDRAEANVSWLYRHEHDSVLGTTNGVDVRAGVAYKIGQLTVSADLEYDMLDIADSDEDGLSLWIKVRRDFPNLLGNRPR